MTDAVDTSKSLAKRVVARQRFLEKVIDFAETIIREGGRVIRHKTYDCYTQTEAELMNFAGFSFRTYGAFTMFGGEELKIWYHPDSKERPPQPVLEVEWYEMAKLKVKHFDTSVKWQRALSRIIKDKEKVVARVRREKEISKARAGRAALRQASLDRANKNLEEAAKRLRLV